VVRTNSLLVLAKQVGSDIWRTGGLRLGLRHFSLLGTAFMVLGCSTYLQQCQKRKDNQFLKKKSLKSILGVVSPVI
jgi:hypothetical protein